MKTTILILMAIICFACKKESTQNGLQIRLKNISQEKFKDIVVNTSGGESLYETLQPNKKTKYAQYDSAFSYAYVKLKIKTEYYTIQPIDYFEPKLKDGKYTYNIGFKDGQLFMELEND